MDSWFVLRHQFTKRARSCSRPVASQHGTNDRAWGVCPAAPGPPTEVPHGQAPAVARQAPRTLVGLGWWMGTVKRNVLPAPTVLSAQIVPPWIWTMHWEM